jgi:hypothetical protein
VTAFSAAPPHWRGGKSEDAMRISKKLLAITGLLALGSAVASGPAVAGEVTGSGKLIEINGRSECAYSGLNDNTPDPRDPGGRTQSYGTNVGQFDLVDPSDLDPTAPYFQPIPGWACNPNRGRDLNAGN